MHGWRNEVEVTKDAMKFWCKDATSFGETAPSIVDHWLLWLWTRTFTAGNSLASSWWKIVLCLNVAQRPVSLKIFTCNWNSIETLFCCDLVLIILLQIFRWFSARQQYLQCVSNGDTAVSHEAIDLHMPWQQKCHVSCKILPSPQC